MNLKEKIRTVPNWPVKGVMFRDITTLLQDPTAFRAACDAFYTVTTT
jgi:adenine phosphoribosyltransferase